MAFQFPQPSVEPSPRRVRVRLGGTVVADSSRTLLLRQYGPEGFPTYYFPREDVRPGALAEDDDGLTVVAGSRRVPGGARTSDAFDELKGRVTFSWEPPLEWYEEDERVYAHARDPQHRVDTVRASRRVEVFVGGERVAHSVRPLALYETMLPVRWYLPFADVRTDLLSASETVTYCPYKGQARYWSHPEVADVAWSYPDPVPENPKIAGLLCFYNERVDLVVDGVPQQRPDSPF
jgi:uncharacterized protein (DUF427 family)